MHLTDDFRWKAGLGLLVGLTACAFSGCTAPRRTTPPEQRVVSASAANLVFNPPAARDVPPITDRSPWPAVVHYDTTGEVIYYRERIRDYQGRLWPEHLNYYRRFESVREGEAVRHP